MPPAPPRLPSAAPPLPPPYPPLATIGRAAGSQGIGNNPADRGSLGDPTSAIAAAHANGHAPSSLTVFLVACGALIVCALFCGPHLYRRHCRRRVIVGDLRVGKPRPQLQGQAEGANARRLSLRVASALGLDQQPSELPDDSAAAADDAPLDSRRLSVRVAVALGMKVVVDDVWPERSLEKDADSRGARIADPDTCGERASLVEVAFGADPDDQPPAPPEGSLVRHTSAGMRV